ncbi:hypothetical protein ERJ75_000644300 [Trypanosoma vivax]|nr:hypothetical protein ERJ75_000644300 [Trypanosoma vivax]
MGTGRTAAHTFLSDPRRVATANLSRQVWPTVGCGPGLVCSAIASEGGSRCNAAHAGHGDALWRGCAAEGRLCREAKGTQRSRCRPVRSAESARNSPALSNTLRIRRGRCFGEGHGCGNGMRCASRGAWRGRGGGKRVARRRGDAFEKARRFAHASVVVIERGAHPRIPTQLGIQPGPPELPPSTARCPGHRPSLREVPRSWKPPCGETAGYGRVAMRVPEGRVQRQGVKVRFSMGATFRGEAGWAEYPL